MLLIGDIVEDKINVIDIRCNVIIVPDGNQLTTNTEKLAIHGESSGSLYPFKPLGFGC